MLGIICNEFRVASRTVSLRSQRRIENTHCRCTLARGRRPAPRSLPTPVARRLAQSETRNAQTRRCGVALVDLARVRTRAVETAVGGDEEHSSGERRRGSDEGRNPPVGYKGGRSELNDKTTTTTHLLPTSPPHHPPTPTTTTTTMGLIKTGIQAGVAYAAVNKVANAVEANAKAKGSNKVPPHAPCNCPHCPYSAQAVYGGLRDETELTPQATTTPTARATPRTTPTARVPTPRHSRARMRATTPRRRARLSRATLTACSSAAPTALTTRRPTSRASSFAAGWGGG